AGAVSVAIVGLRIRPGEANFLSSVIRPVAIASAVPAIWMLIQAMPLQSSGLAHPIWKTTAASLGLPLAGSISVDPGATLISFVQYLSTTAIGFVAAALAINRRRAELIFFALIIVATLIALLELAFVLGIFSFQGFGGGQARAITADCASLGVVFAAAASIQSKTSQSDQTIYFAASLTALATCWLATIAGASATTHFAVICGVVTLIVTT